MMRSEGSFLRLCLLLVLLALPRPVLAGKPIRVGDGTPASCTEIALKDALIIAETVGGATIRFRCGREPLTIELHEVTTAPGFAVLLILPDNTTIDGDNLITLNGTHTATVAYVPLGATVVLKQLTITGGFSAGPESGPGGGILNDGTLALHRSTVSGNFSILGGGGIFTRGDLTIDHSTISSNGAFFPGGGIWAPGAGMITVRHSIFEHNSTAYWGGAIAGLVSIDRSTFAHNHAEDDGGAIIGGGTIERSTFSDNDSFRGGAISTGSMSIDKSTFTGNHAGYGGAIYALGEVVIDQSDVSENAASYGGGLFIVEGEVTIARSRVTHNGALSGGGGIYLCAEGAFDPGCQGLAGHVTLRHTSVAENTPDDIFP
jgi:predicted outer membrane repeat protein